MPNPTQSKIRTLVKLQKRDGTWLNLGLCASFTGGDKAGDPEDWFEGDGTRIILDVDTTRQPGKAVFRIAGPIAAVWDQIDDLAGNAACQVVRSYVDGNTGTWFSYTLTGKYTGYTEPEGGGGKNSAAQTELSFSFDDKALIG